MSTVHLEQNRGIAREREREREIIATRDGIPILMETMTDDDRTQWKNEFSRVQEWGGNSSFLASKSR